MGAAICWWPLEAWLFCLLVFYLLTADVCTFLVMVRPLHYGFVDFLCHLSYKMKYKQRVISICVLGSLSGSERSLFFIRMLFVSVIKDIF